MSEELLIQYCSPTLAGMKTGNMFSCRFQDKEEMKVKIRYWNRTFRKKGIRILPLRFRCGQGLIYVYRISRLKEDLKEKRARRILEERGYDSCQPEQCILKLIERLGTHEEFPHEVGLFLGYPPEDVCGFIENNAKNCKCVGCWKVYGDEKAAQDTFFRYKRCTAAYKKQLANGMTVEGLTVAG